jgi:iron(III) transport system permease protein
VPSNRLIHSYFSTDPILRAVQVFVILAIILLLIPILALVLTAVSGDSGFTLDNFRLLFQHSQFWPTTINTMINGVGTVIVMVVFTVPLAWLYTRTDMPGKNLLVAFVTINVAIPSFLVALGYIFMFNPSNGVFNVMWRSVMDSSVSPVNVYSLGWIFFLQGVAVTSPAFFMLVPTLQGIDSSLEEAAAANGVRRWKSALHIVVPLVIPALVAVSAYYFIIAIEKFDYAGMLGDPAHIYVAASLLYNFIHNASTFPRYGEAAALGVMLAGVALVLSFIYLWAVRNADRFVVLTGKRREQVPIKLTPRGRFLAWSFIWLYFAVGTALPLMMLIWASGMPFLKVPSWSSLHDWNLDAYWNVLPLVPELLKNNLILMLVVPTGGVILGACMAWVGTRFKSWMRRGIDVTVMIAVAVPSIVGALGFLTFGLSAHSYFPIYGTIWLMAIAMVSKYLTWSNRTITGSMMQIHPEIEEAATVSGVRKGRIFTSIILPNVARSMFIAWFWLALLSLRELTIPIMLVRDGSDVFATVIWNLNGSGVTDEAAALSVILAVIILAMVGVFQVITTKWKIQQ